MQRRSLGPFRVSSIGLGCMNLSHAYGPAVAFAQAERLLLSALDAGVDFFDTATLYGFGANEELVGRVLGPHRNRFVLASKCGMEGRAGEDGVKRRVIDARPQTLKRQVEESLRRLNTEVIDVYYLHRFDKSVPIEESVGALGEMVKKGHLRAIGLSEVSAATLRKAHAEFPIAAVQSEYSLWTRNPELGVLQACREIGAAFVAFSPLARAYLTGRLTDLSGLHEGDIRRAMPRFSPEIYARNLALLPRFEAIAREVGATPAQFALAWLLHKGEDIIPIPGTTNLDHLGENLTAATLTLSEAVLREAEALINPQSVVGARYNPQGESEVDTETFNA